MLSAPKFKDRCRVWPRNKIEPLNSEWGFWGMILEEATCKMSRRWREKGEKYGEAQVSSPWGGKEAGAPEAPVLLGPWLPPTFPSTCEPRSFFYPTDPRIFSLFLSLFLLRAQNLSSPPTAHRHHSRTPLILSGFVPRPPVDAGDRRQCPTLRTMKFHLHIKRSKRLATTNYKTEQPQQYTIRKVM